MSGIADHLGPLAEQSDAVRILAPCYIGWQIQLFLCGFSTKMALSYLRSFRHERKTRMMIVSAITFFNLFAACINFAESYMYGVSQQRSYSSLDGYNVADSLQTIPAGLVAALAQSYLAYRAFIFTRSKVFAIGISMCIAMSFAGAVGAAYGGFRYMIDSNNDDLIYKWTMVWLWPQAATDLIISSTLCYSLYRMKSTIERQPDQNNTSYLFEAVIRLTLTTGLLPAAFTMLSALLYICTKSGPNWNAFNAVVPFLPSCYAISVFYNLSQTSRKDDNSPTAIMRDNLSPAQASRFGDSQSSKMNLGDAIEAQIMRSYKNERLRTFELRDQEKDDMPPSPIKIHIDTVQHVDYV